MDSDFSFVLISSNQSASKKKRIRHEKSASTEKKLVVKYQIHCVDNISQHYNNKETLNVVEKKECLLEEYDKENNWNMSNQHSSNEMHKRTNDSKNLYITKENRSYEFSNISDLKNVCIRKRQRRTELCERRYNMRSSCKTIDDNDQSSLEEFKKDPYAVILADDSFKKSFSTKRASVNGCVSSNLTKKNTLLESSNNILKQNSRNIVFKRTRHTSSGDIISSNKISPIDPCTLNSSVNTSYVSSDDKSSKQIKGELSTCTSKSYRKNYSIGSSLRNNRLTLEVSDDDILNHTSSDNLCKGLSSNSFVYDPNQRPMLLRRKTISKTPEINKSHLQSSKLRKISSSSYRVPSGNELDDNSVISNVNNSGIKNPTVVIVEEKLKSCNDTDVKLSDVSAIDSSLDYSQSVRRNLQDDFPIIFEMNTPKNRKKSQTARNKNINNSIPDNSNTNFKKERKFFKKQEINIARSKSSFNNKKSCSPDIATQISADIVDLSSPNLSVEQSQIIPISTVKETNNKFHIKEINTKKSLKKKKQIAQDDICKKTSNINKTLDITDKPKCFKGNGNKKCRPAKQKNSSNSIKSNRRSSLKLITSLSCSPDIATPQKSAEIVDLNMSNSSDNLSVEQTHIIPTSTVEETNKKNFHNTEINTKKSPKKKKQTTQDSICEKPSSINKTLDITEKRKFFKGNDNKKCKPAKQTDSSNSIKSNQRSSLKLITPSLSVDKLKNISNWLQDTSKHKTALNNECEDLYSFHEQEVDTESSNKHITDEYEINSNSGSSIISESVGISENILNKLYGSVWQKQRHEVLPQSEPRKKSKKNTQEQKKQRTSIYDVFSSSSSEDRFEQFLENVHMRKIKPKNSVNKLSTPDFIHDSSENDTSMTFYQSHIAKDIKSEVGNVVKNKLNLTLFSQQKTGKHRRLSFGSSSSTTTDNEVKHIKKASKSKEKSCNKDEKSIFKNTNDTVTKKVESNLNLNENGIDDISKEKENEYNKLDNFQNILKPKTERKSFDTKSKKTITDENDFSGNILKVTTKHDIKSDSKTLVKKNNIKNKVLPKSNGKLPVKTFNMKDFNRDEKDKENKNVNEVDILNTPLPEPRKPRNAAGSPGLILSFLSSLSDITGNLKCHPEAVLYKQNYKKKKEELARKLFNLFNKEIFALQLPNDMLIQWNLRMRSTSGFCVNKKTCLPKGEILRTSRIVLSTKILDSAARLRDTLVHELCHAAAWIINGTSDGHGPNWKAWADKANRRFPELPRIKRCHDYAIKTKYTYKCIGCGYCIGRHSKSLDTNRKRCGYCYGQFEVFLTSKIHSDHAPSESDLVKNPRTPSAFAMFVKENYGQVKKENNLPHGDIMKLLGQKFAAVKLSKG